MDFCNAQNSHTHITYIFDNKILMCCRQSAVVISHSRMNCVAQMNQKSIIFGNLSVLLCGIHASDRQSMMMWRCTVLWNGIRLRKGKDRHTAIIVLLPPLKSNYIELDLARRSNDWLTDCIYKLPEYDMVSFQFCQNNQNYQNYQLSIINYQNWMKRLKKRTTHFEILIENEFQALFIDDHNYTADPFLRYLSTCFHH